MDYKTNKFFQKKDWELYVFNGIYYVRVNGFIWVFDLIFSVKLIIKKKYVSKIKSSQ